MPITVSDYIFKKISDQGVKDVFLVSGGGIMYLCDAVARNPKLKYWANYHEQASAIAAEAYARVTEGLGCCLVTWGPGSTNALSGVASAYMDSIPMIVISGQVRTQIMADYSRQRQVGPQEVNIIPMAEPVTKYAVTIMDAKRTRYEVEKSLFLALNGRPGPTWINVPLDIQNTLIEPEELEGYDNNLDPLPKINEDEISLISKLLLASKRPVIIGGNGIVLSRARRQFKKLVELLKIPTMTTISGMDLLSEDHPFFQGRFGPGGQRRANFALQNSDLVLAIGTSLSISCVGFSDRFAPKATRILVNIDEGDLEKKNISVEHVICADAKRFIEALSNKLEHKNYVPSKRWIEACADWKRSYPVTPSEEFLVKNEVDTYLLYERLSDLMNNDDIVVSGNSLDGCIIAYQAHKVKDGQRAFTSCCYGSMGWDLPAILGACIADKNRRGVLITGDGSILFNIHELMFLGLHKLNTKIFIINNDGYQSMRGTFDRFFEGNHVGADERSGVANPDFESLSKAFRVNYLKINNNDELEQGIHKVFSDTGPWLVEVIGSKDQKRFRAGSYKKPDGTLASRPMEDMEPLLPRDEFEKNMTMFDSDV